MRPVPVFMYHHVNSHQGDTVTVTPEVFEGQMRFLYESGYQTLRIEELMDYIAGSYSLKRKAAVITFDDGWLDNYLFAVPILREYRINTTVFIVTDRIEHASASTSSLPESIPTHNESKALLRQGEASRVSLNWRLIGEMAGTGLVEFYSHTKSHRKCSLLSEHELVEELRESKEIIEKRLGRQCPYLCWPYGDYSPAAARIAKDAGYRGLFTTLHGVVTVGSDPFAIKRIVVKDKVKWFKNRTTVYTSPLLSMLYLKVKKK